LATPQPSRRVSGSTRINWITSMTRKRRIFEPSLLATVHAIRSLLSVPKQRFSHNLQIKLQTRSSGKDLTVSALFQMLLSLLLKD
jgi:hypothetical protein